MTASVTFDTTVTATGNNTGIVVPDEMIEQLGAGRRPAVVVNVNGYEYQNTVGVMGGRHMISISAAVRKETGLKAGDPIHVVLTLAGGPRAVTVPSDLAAALSADPAAEAFFAKLSSSLQRYHVDNINAARTAETRQRRVDKAVSPCSGRESNGESRTARNRAPGASGRSPSRCPRAPPAAPPRQAPPRWPACPGSAGGTRPSPQPGPLHVARGNSAEADQVPTQCRSQAPRGNEQSARLHEAEAEPALDHTDPAAWSL